jgi:dihydroorotase
MAKLLFKNARIIDPASDTDLVGDLLIEEGKVATISSNPLSVDDAQIVDASDKWLMPGIVDLGAYVRHQELKATVESESAAAANAGITRLCCMPEYAKPTDSTAEVNLIKEKASNSGKVWFEVIGAMTEGLKGEQLTNMGGLKKAGCIAVSQGHHKFISLDVMRKAMEYAKTCDLRLFLHPLEYGLVGEGCVHEGAMATRLGLPGVPVTSETIALSNILLMAEHMGSQVHICRLSSAAGVEMVRQAKARGISVTADVAAHQLHLSELDIKDYNPLCYTLPPLRALSDQAALREGLKDGAIDAICSDHQPHNIDAKLAPFQEASPGISALETLLPLTMQLVEDGVVDLKTAIGSLSANPAAIIDRTAGSLSLGDSADILLYDPKLSWTLDASTIFSNGKNTPFVGRSFIGKVIQTYVRGQRADTYS